MKKLGYTLLLTLFIVQLSEAQSGAQVHLQVGRSDMGYDTWYESTDLTFSVLFPVSPAITVGGFYTFGFTNKYVENSSLDLNSQMKEFGVISRYTITRVGKFSIYGQNTFSKLSLDNTDNPSPPQSNNPELLIKDSSFGFGAGVGFTYLVAPGLTLNIFEFDLTFFKKDFITIDRQVHKDYKIGISYSLGKSK